MKAITKRKLLFSCLNWQMNKILTVLFYFACLSLIMWLKQNHFNTSTIFSLFSVRCSFSWARNINEWDQWRWYLLYCKSHGTELNNKKVNGIKIHFSILNSSHKNGTVMHNTQVMWDYLHWTFLKSSMVLAFLQFLLIVGQLIFTDCYEISYNQKNCPLWFEADRLWCWTEPRTDQWLSK